MAAAFKHFILYIESGKNVVLMDNGTVAEDPLVAEGQLGGVGNVATQAKPQPLILPIGIYKKRDKKGNELAAYMHLAALSDGTFEARRDVTPWLKLSQQRAINIAYLHAEGMVSPAVYRRPELLAA